MDKVMTMFGKGKQNPQKSNFPNNQKQNFPPNLPKMPFQNQNPFPYSQPSPATQNNFPAPTKFSPFNPSSFHSAPQNNNFPQPNKFDNQYGFGGRKNNPHQNFPYGAQADKIKQGMKNFIAKTKKKEYPPVMNSNQYYQKNDFQGFGYNNQEMQDYNDYNKYNDFNDYNDYNDFMQGGFPQGMPTQQMIPPQQKEPRGPKPKRGPRGNIGKTYGSEDFPPNATNPHFPPRNRYNDQMKRYPEDNAFPIQDDSFDEGGSNEEYLPKKPRPKKPKIESKKFKGPRLDKKFNDKENNLINREKDEDIEIENDMENENENEDIKEEKVKINFQSFLKKKKIEREKSVSVEKPIENKSAKVVSKEKALLERMCSEKEALEREEQNLLSIFELDPNRSFYDDETGMMIKKVNLEYAVKAYTRPGGDLNKKDPENIRTPQALEKTMNYIIDEIVDSDHITNPKFSTLNEITLSEVCIFVSDRFKAITQDFTVQELKGNKLNIDSTEKMARFLIICLNETLDLKAISGEQGLYHLNMNQLNSVLTSLSEFYEYASNEKKKNADADVYISPNEDEFLTYFLLLSLKQRPIEFTSMITKIPKEMRHRPKMSFGLKISKAIFSKDWVKFMELLKSPECDYLTSCLMVLFFTDMKITALKEISNSRTQVSNYQISLNKLVKLLPFDNTSECIEFLHWFGVEVNDQCIMNQDLNFSLVRRDAYIEVDAAKAPIKTNHTYVESKRGNLTRREIILCTQAKHIEKTSNSLFGFESKKESLFENTILFQPKEKSPEKSNDGLFKSSLFGNNEKEKPVSRKVSEIEPSPAKSSSKLVFDSVPMKTSFELGSQRVEEIPISSSIFPPKKQETVVDLKESALKLLVGLLDIKSKEYLYQSNIHFFSFLRLIYEKSKLSDKLRERFIKRKKLLVFSELRQFWLEAKHNREYLKEMVKYNMNISSLYTRENHKFSSSSIEYEVPFSLYNFQELKYFLLENARDKMHDSNTINYLQVNIYTTKNLFLSTNIFQELNISNDSLQISKDEFIVYEPNILFDNQSYSLYIRVIYLDQIDSFENFVFLNRENLNKFSFGIVFFELTDTEIFSRFLSMMDISLGDVLKKNFIFTFFYQNEVQELEFDKAFSIVTELSKKYQNKKFSAEPMYIGDISKFDPSCSNLLNYHNNKAFVELFKDTISFLSYNLSTPLISLSQHNNTIRYNYFIRKFTRDYSFTDYHVLLQQILLGIGLVKITCMYYSKILSDFANKLFNIPLYDSNNELIRVEDNVFIGAKLFDSLSKIKLEYDFSSNDPLICFEYIIKEYMIICINEGVNRNEIMYVIEEMRKQYYQSSIDNLSYLVNAFFSQIIDLISRTLGIMIDQQFSYETYNSVFEKEKTEIFDLIRTILYQFESIDKMNDLYNNSEFYTGKVLTKNLNDNQNFFVNQKRGRNFETDKIKKDLQLNLQYLVKPDKKENASISFSNNNYIKVKQLQHFTPCVVKKNFI